MVFCAHVGHQTGTCLITRRSAFYRLYDGHHRCAEQERYDGGSFVCRHIRDDVNLGPLMSTAGGACKHQRVIIGEMNPHCAV